MSRRVYDLSVPVVNGADWYNEEITPPVRIEDIGNIETEGWVSQTISLAPLNGTTYLETSAHLLQDGELLADIPPERFLCRTHVVAVELSGQEILAPGQALADFRKGDDAILVYCGWDAHLNNPDFYWKSPYFSEPMQAWLLDHQPSILGGDMMSYDHPEATDMPFLRAYFKAGGIILCPLQGLAEIAGKAVTLCAAPTRIAKANCAPCRALAWI